MINGWIDDAIVALDVFILNNLHIFRMSVDFSFIIQLKSYPVTLESTLNNMYSTTISLVCRSLQPSQQDSQALLYGYQQWRDTQGQENDISLKTAGERVY